MNKPIHGLGLVTALLASTATLSAATFTVTNTNDSGSGSLRQAIVEANSSEGDDLIDFDIPGPEVHTITPTSALPQMGSGGWRVMIDGYTQPGASPNTQLTSDDAILLIELNGESAGDSDGLAGQNLTVRGLVINRFRTNVVLDVGETLEGCFIGTDPTGTIARSRPGGVGVRAFGAAIGGPLPAQRNLISGNGGTGITGGGLSIQGNFIGLDATGIVGLPNSIGVDTDSYGAWIGGPSSPAGTTPGNVISGNTSYGIRFEAWGNAGMTIQGNLIGTNATGTAAVPNGSHGVLISRACPTPPCTGLPGRVTVGGNGPEQGNVIAYNLGDGIHTAPAGVETYLGTNFRSNRIHSNAGLGIDLYDDGVTPNTPYSASNYPILTTAASAAGTTVIQGTLNSEPNAFSVAIEFYSSSGCDASGNGEGATPIGSTTVQTDAGGDAAVSVVLALSLEPGSVVTATATRGPITSEFSACRIVTDVLPTLRVLGVSPGSGPAAGGTPVTVTGVGFVTGASLAIGGLPATAVVVVDPFTITAATPALSPGTRNDVSVSNPPSGPPGSTHESATLPAGWISDFVDVPRGDIFHDHVETMFRTGITAGCGGGAYCRNTEIRRDQMAVFLLKAMYGPSYAPPPCLGVFNDVPCPGPFADWIEQLAAEAITGGCGNGYCPDWPVNRRDMAVFLLRAEHGAEYVPPFCTPPGLFLDVPCPDDTYARWVEQLAAEGVTAGCGGGYYCPFDTLTRGQMAVFLTKTFNLQ